MNNLDSISSPTLHPPLAGHRDTWAGPAGEPDLPEVVIRPRSGWIAIDWNELIHYRELLYFLAWRDVMVRYKQTVLGVAWAVLQPLFTMLIFTLIFGRFAGVRTGDVPY